MPHCWKSHVAAHTCILKTEEVTGDSWSTVLRIRRENVVVTEEIRLNKMEKRNCIKEKILPIYTEWTFPLLSIGPVNFRLKGRWVVVFIFIQILIQHSVTVETLITRRILRCLVWVATVCLCPIKRTKIVTIINLAYGIQTYEAELKNNCAIFMCSTHWATQATDRQVFIFAIYIYSDIKYHMHFHICTYDEGRRYI